MNVQVLNKYRSLDQLLGVLAIWKTADCLEISDRWRDNEQALGLCKPSEPGLAAFLFTYAQETGRYGVHLEYPEQDRALQSGVPLSYENLSLGQLIQVLALHFDIPERSTERDLPVGGQAAP
jgi:hypothetical protein